MEEQNKALNPQEQIGPEPSRPGPLKPHRGGIVLALGILGIFFIFLPGIILSFSVKSERPPLEVLGLLPIVGFILGSIAWVKGENNLNDMDAGIMDPTGRGLTQAGKICGLICVVLMILFLVFAILIAGDIRR